MWFRKFTSCVVLLFAGLFAGAQVNFVATINPDPATVNNYVTLEYTIAGSSEIEKLDLPDLKSFRLISGPSSRSSVSIINGKRSRNFAVSFVLIPLEEGKLHIPGATAIVNGTSITSNAVNLTVNKGEAKTDSEEDFYLSPDEDPQEKIKSNMHLVLELSKKNVFVGEPVIATYKLYSRLKGNSRLVKNPSFKGFSVVDLQLPTETNSYKTTRDGKEYTVYEVRKVKLFPLQTGLIEIEPLELENEVHFLSKQYSPDPFGWMDVPFAGNYVVRYAEMASNTAFVNVKPLPENNKPESFSGAVGSFSVQAHVNQPSITTRQEGKLVFSIWGDGNFSLINPPQVNWPDGMEHYEPEVKDTIDAGGIAGKSFTFSFSSMKPGEYVVPPVEFSFFDPERAGYVTRETAAIPVTVTGDALMTNAETVMKSFSSKSGKGWALPLAAFGAVTMAFLLFFIIRKRKGKLQPVETIVAEPNFNADPLSKSRSGLNSMDNNTFYATLNTELRQMLIAQFCADVSVASLHYLRQCMHEKNIPAPLIEETMDLLESVEKELYTPIHLAAGKIPYFKRAEEVAEKIISHCRG